MKASEIKWSFHLSFADRSNPYVHFPCSHEEHEKALDEWRKNYDLEFVKLANFCEFFVATLKPEIANPVRNLKDLKRGEWFTLKPISEPKASQVYIREEYDRSAKKYCVGKFEDISYSRLLSGTTPVYTEFTF